MQLADFDYKLPDELIAEKPLENRDASKLLVFDGKTILDKNFTDIVDFLKPNDLLVLNDTKVIPARLTGTCDGKKIEITLLKRQQGADEIWEVLAKPAKRLLINESFMIADGLAGSVLGKKESGEVIIKFPADNFFEKLQKYGKMPLPPYIEKKRKADTSDNNTYQTTYANQQKQGSVAAPTAGLHFTETVFAKLKAKGIDTAFITLHVGGGTFLPVRVDDVKTHKMHGEFYDINFETAEKINNTIRKGGRVIAVGTTSLRTLEYAADENGFVKSGSGETNIFIYPGYRFKMVSALVTNFHLPKSTLFMLVSAFMGLDNMKRTYQHAIDKKYRFFSYGDSSLLIRDVVK